MAGDKQKDVVPNGFPLTTAELLELEKKWAGITNESTIEKADNLDEDDLQATQPVVKEELIKVRVIEILKQRNNQRKEIFKHAKWFCWTSLFLLVAIISVQIVVRVVGPEPTFNVFDNNELEVLVIGVFGQFVGLLYVITRSLYDDKNYKNMFEDALKS